MADFIGTLNNITTGQQQNVIAYRYDGDRWLSGVVVEGDRVAHDYSKSDYTFVPREKTFQEQFAELPIGTRFMLKDAYGNNVGERIKVDKDRYSNPGDLIRKDAVMSGARLEIVG